MASPNKQQDKHLIVGWKEWVDLPELGLRRLKVKIDTGARTSALHAFSIEPFAKDGRQWVRFGIHPKQNNNEIEVFCEAEVTDQRTVSDSGGHKESRYVITTPINLGNEQWPIEITLSNRNNMRFRMLLGRTAMRGRLCVDPNAAYLLGKPARHSKHSH